MKVNTRMNKDGEYRLVLQIDDRLDFHITPLLYGVELYTVVVRVVVLITHQKPVSFMSIQIL